MVRWADPTGRASEAMIHGDFADHELEHFCSIDGDNLEPGWCFQILLVL